jgi:hypothetical protein
MAVVTTIAKSLFSCLTFAEDSQFSPFHVRNQMPGSMWNPKAFL